MIHRFFALLIALILASAQSAHALSLIRDAEIENTLRQYGDPIFETAGLTPEVVRFFIINSPDINAFVAGGSNIFINTGLIKAATTPDMLIGVIAHETGHIAGGHIPQGAEKMKNAQLGVILGYVLGAAAIVAGSKDAGAAIMTGSAHTAQRSLLSYSRMNEQAADQSALRTLDRLGISASGMLRMFEVLRKQEDRHFGAPDPYTLTHPLSKERIIHVRNQVNQSRIPAGRVPEQFIAMHKRMRAKLIGFTEPLAATLQAYPLKDNSVEARYARAIAYYRVPELAKALKEIDSLIAAAPADGYFHELRGQILFENGKLPEALRAYQNAVKLLPAATLIRVDYAKAQLAMGRLTLINEAIGNLERTTLEDKDNPAAWRLLAEAYGKRGTSSTSGNGKDIALSYICLAEEAILENSPDIASQHARRALEMLPKNSPAYLRAEDIRNLAEEMKK